MAETCANYAMCLVYHAVAITDGVIANPRPEINKTNDLKARSLNFIKVFGVVTAHGACTKNCVIEGSVAAFGE